MGAFLCSLFQGKTVAGQGYRQTTEDDPHPDERRTAQQQLVHDVAEVGMETAELDHIFKDIDGGLLKISTSPSCLFHGSFRSSVRELRNECTRIQTAYQSSVWNTREIAGEVQALATDFVQVCIPRLQDTTFPVAGDKITELKDYERAIRDRTSKIQNIRDAFGKLSEHVNTIGNTWLSLTTKHKFVMFERKPITLKFKQACALVSSVSYPNEQKGTSFLLQVLSPAFVEKQTSDMPTYSLDSDHTLVGVSQRSSHGLFSKTVAICYLLSAISADIRSLRETIDPEHRPNYDTLRKTLNDRLTGVEQTYRCVIDAMQDYQTSIASPQLRN